MMLQIGGDRCDRRSLIATPPLPECEFSAFVPVKDEAQTLRETLADYSSARPSISNNIICRAGNRSKCRFAISDFRQQIARFDRLNYHPILN
jgi:hypothetical protein